MLFREKLVAAFNNHAHRSAFCIQGEYYSYARLQAKVAGIQAVLSDAHKDVQRVGIVITDSIDTYAAVVALLLMGKAYIPIHPGHPADRVERIISQAGLQLVLSAVSGDVYSGITNLDTTSVSGVETLEYLIDDVSDREAYILFTSGSTGIPKGTPITYHNLDSFLSAFDELGYIITEDDRFLQMFDLTFDLSVMSYLVPLCAGACVYTIPEKGMKYTNVFGVLEEYRITFALMVPSILTFLRQYFDEINLPDMRYSLFCGEALHKDVAVEWQACVPNAVIENVYGPTEATIFCLSYRVDAAKGIIENNGIIGIGKPMSGMSAIVADENNQPVAPGEKGELCLCGGQLTPGYLDSEKNKTVFFELDGSRYYRTGDIAFKNPGGDFIYCGRADHQVKIQGFRIELSEIEHHSRTAHACNAVAIVIENAAGLSQIDVVLETEPIDKETVLSGLKTKLPPYMMPTGIHFITPFPLNVNGKTDRKELEKRIKTAAA